MWLGRVKASVKQSNREIAELYGGVGVDFQSLMKIDFKVESYI